MANNTTDLDLLSQLQNIRSEIAQVKGLSKFTARLFINNAKNQGIDLVTQTLEKFTITKAMIYLLVDGFRSSVKIGKIVGIKQQSAHEQLHWLIKEGLIEADNMGSSKAAYRKSSVEEVIGLSNLLKRKFNLHDWLAKAIINDAE